MYAIWREVGEFEISEQRSADQVRAIMVNDFWSGWEIKFVPGVLEALGSVLSTMNNNLGTIEEGNPVKLIQRYAKIPRTGESVDRA